MSGAEAQAAAMSAASERFLVTGAYGCIGAWVTRELVRLGLPVVTYDLGGSDHRLVQVLSPDELERVVRVHGDITDLGRLERAIDEQAITNVIHLAALQVPFCRENPSLGARVNVEGTVNVLEAVKRRRDRMRHLVYASSVAVYDAAGDGAVPLGLSGTPPTLYGVYKRANEGCAAVYWADDGVSSIGLRPHTVYGVARDQGMTSVVTRAMLAAAVGRPFDIPYGGSSQLQYAPDAAHAFVAASRVAYEGAAVHNLSGEVVAIRDVIEAIVKVAPSAAGRITFADVTLPVPEEVDAASLASIIGSPRDTPLEEGVRETIARFRHLVERDLVDVGSLG